MENILSGNPLINLAGQQQQQINQTQNTFRVKRRYLIKTHNHAQSDQIINTLYYLTFYFFVSRWDDDVVFKNCAKGVDEARKEKRFVNDTLRSEFHKKFMEKYVK